MNQTIQQGDVLLHQRTALPPGCTPVVATARGYVLAEGEHTGHAHVITETPEVEMYTDAAGTLWLRVIEEATTVTHEEHHAQTIAPGVYEVGRVREVDPFADAIRTVAD